MSGPYSDNKMCTHPMGSGPKKRGTHYCELEVTNLQDYASRHKYKLRTTSLPRGVSGKGRSRTSIRRTRPRAKHPQRKAQHKPVAEPFRGSTVSPMWVQIIRNDVYNWRLNLFVALL